MAAGTGEDVAAFTENSHHSRVRLAPGAARALLAGVAVVLLGAWAWMAMQNGITTGLIAGETDGPASTDAEPAVTLPPHESPSPLETELALTVYVSGGVVVPGVYTAPGGSRVADFIELAGGFVADADPNAVNLAALVDDGAHVIVPLQGETPAVPASGSESSGLVNLNTAGVDQLDELPGIGPVMAENIVAWREENGPFSSVEDLLSVPGIGESKLAKLRDHAAV